MSLTFNQKLTLLKFTSIKNKYSLNFSLQSASDVFNSR